MKAKNVLAMPCQPTGTRNVS